MPTVIMAGDPLLNSGSHRGDAKIAERDGEQEGRIESQLHLFASPRLLRLCGEFLEVIASTERPPFYQLAARRQGEFADCRSRAVRLFAHAVDARTASKEAFMSAVRVSLVSVACCAALALQSGMARGQTGFSQMAAGAVPQFRTPGSYQRVSGRDNPGAELLRRRSLAALRPQRTHAADAGAAAGEHWGHR